VAGFSFGRCKREGEIEWSRARERTTRLNTARSADQLLSWSAVQRNLDRSVSMLLNARMFTLGELASRVNATVAGDAALEINWVRPFDAAGPGDLTLAADRKHLAQLEGTGASAIIVPLGTPPSVTKSLLLTDQPKVVFARLLAVFTEKPFIARGVSPLAHIGKRSSIPPDVTIASFAYIGDDVVVGDRVTIMSGTHVGDGCSIGAGCTLHPNVVLYPGITLGQRVILHSGCVIGADGFGYVFDGHEQVPIPQTGTVVIGDDVEIGANSCVDRATFGETVIERGVKIDNQVHIAHNCRVGENTVIVAQVGISGSVEIGRNCVFAGHSGVVDHVKIGDGVRVMMKTAVSKDVPSGSSVSGQPAMDHRRSLKIQAAVRRLPEVLDKLRAAGDLPGDESSQE